MEYSEVAPYYDKWCSGDEDCEKTEKFYLEILRNAGHCLAEPGVGTGRVALKILEKYDKHVVGIDRCEEMLDICRARYAAKPHTGTLELIKDDFLTFRLREPADCIYIPFRTIGHILSNPELLRFMKNVENNLKPGGKFIFDHYIFDPVWAEENNRKDILLYQDEKIRIEDSTDHDFVNRIVHCTVKCNDVVMETITFRWLEVLEVLELVSASEFSIEKLYGGYSFENWTSTSKNQIWVLSKNGA
ncbi:MAG: class I SAM-dependent methyltransferase [Synergistaceae bacterium]|jgi:SAM-dependent methyltransferase|nr:class I SAM-dependent methyltransferase [Synergistaceae bacterium]